MGMKFDGKTLKDGSKTLANVRGDKIMEGTSSSRTLANIRGDKLMDKTSSSTCLANYRSGKVYEKTSSSTKANSFDGFRGAKTDWALWYLFCK